MNNIELSTEQIEALREVLEHQVQQMDIEIDRTDTHDFKKRLQHRRDLLKEIVGRLSAVPA
jgi:hypothetical protein